MKVSQTIADLREGATVLDGPSSRDAVASTMNYAADLLEAQMKAEHTLHVILSDLYSYTDPDIIPAKLLDDICEALGANDPEGSCGNELCEKLTNETN